MGVSTPGTEVAERVEVIRVALTEAGHPVVSAAAHGDEDVLAVHDRALLAHLRDVHKRWLAAGFADDPGQDRVVPYVFPTAAMLGPLPVGPAAAVHARAGQFAYDTMTLVGAGTYRAARAATDCALTAVDRVVAGERVTYALCRPPGHHVTRSAYGGSCYLNNAAVAGQALRGAAGSRSSTSTLITATAPRRSSTSERTCSTARCTSTRAPGGSRTSSGSPTRPGPGPARAPRSTCRWRRGPMTTRGAPPWSGWPARSPGSARRRWSSLSAWTPQPTTRRARSRSVPRATARLAGCWAPWGCRALGLPSVVVQEGGYHLPSLGGLVAAYLAGHEQAAGNAAAPGNP